MKKHAPHTSRRNRSHLLALEPRILFDGVALTDAAVPDKNIASLFEHPTSDPRQASLFDAPAAVLPPQAAAHEIVFIEGNIAQAQQLAAGVRSGVQAIILDPSKDGLDQIAAALNGKTDLSAIHIISHGSDGALQLGELALNDAALQSHSADLAAIHAALASGGDLLLYGCDIAQSAAGVSFIGHLAQTTGADVAASTDATGTATRGGNWTLESTTGAIETTTPFVASTLAAFDGLLAAPTITDGVGSRTTAEDNAIAITGITVADVDVGNSQTVTIVTTNGAITLAGNVGLTALTGDGTTSISFQASAAAATTAMNGMSFRPTKDFSGTATFAISTNDGTTPVSLATKNITVTANANAPVLTLPTAAQTAAEDVASYLDFTGANAIVLTDADANDLQTLTLSVAHGTLTIKTDAAGGITSATSNGTASVALSGTAAQLSATLANVQGVQYTSVLNYNAAAGLGAEALSFALSDGVVAHDKSGSVNLNVTQVNDAPTFTGAVPATVLEGGSVTFSRAQLASSDNALDVDIQTGQQVIAQLMVKIDSLPGGGTLTYKSGAVVIGSVVPVTDLANLRFTHDGTDIVSNQTISFNVTVSDGGGGATAGSISVTVQPKNVAPSISGSPTLIEGQVKVVAPAISLGDNFDTLANSTIVIDSIVDGGQGTLFIDANNNNVVDAGEALSGVTTLDATQRANRAAQLKFSQNGYEPNTPGATSPSYRITVTDAGGGTGTPSAAIQQTITLSVLPNNDDPTLVNTHATVGTALAAQEGNVTTITAAMLQISDADLNPANLNTTTPENQLVYTIGTRPTQGEIQLNIGGGVGYNADGWITLGDGGRFTQAQVAAGVVRYYQTTNVPNAPTVSTDSFTFTVRDSAYGYDVWTDPANPSGPREGGLRATPTGIIATQQFYFNITPLAAVNTGRANNYEGGVRAPTPGYSDSVGSHVVTYSFSTGAMTNGNGAALWNEANVGSPSGYVVTQAMLEYIIKRVDDNATPGVPGDDITVTVPPAETVYTLTVQPGNGTLESNASSSWLAIPTNGQFTQADINAGKIRFIDDGSENHTSTFGYKVSDGTPNNYTSTFALNITPTNDRPGGSGGSVQVAEKSPGNDGLVRLGSSALGMSDIDLSQDAVKRSGEGAQDFLWFAIVDQPVDGGTTQRGVLQRWDGSAWVTVTPGQWLPSTLLTMTVGGATSGLRYEHDGSEPLAYPGSPNVTFNYQVRDDLANPSDPLATSAAVVADSSGSAQSNQSANATTTIKIIPINNAPAIADKPADADPTIGGTIASGGALTGVNNPLLIAYEGGDAFIVNTLLTGIDADNTTVQRQYIIKTPPTQGMLMLGGKLLGVGSTFTQDDIDNSRVTYRHNGSEVGDPTTNALGTYHDKFHFVLSDAVSDDVGTGAPYYNTFLITLTPTNDAPTVAGPTGIILIDSATPANNPVSGFSLADPDLVNGVQAGETDFIQATVRLLDSAGVAISNYTTGFAGGGVSIGYTTPVDVTGLWAVTQNGSNNILQVQGTRAQVNAALAGLNVTFANDANLMYKVQVIADDLQ